MTKQCSYNDILNKTTAICDLSEHLQTTVVPISNSPLLYSTERCDIMKSIKERAVFNMTTIQNIGMQIAKLRKENNITQDELAKKLDVSAQAVSKWENGGAPDLDLLPKIADYFGVSIDYLFGRQIKTDSGFTQKEFLERLDAVRKQISENPMFLYNDTIKSLVAFEFEDDEAKRDSIDSITSAFCAREELQRKLMENYQRMYEQTLTSERKQK